MTRNPYCFLSEERQQELCMIAESGAPMTAIRLAISETADVCAAIVRNDFGGSEVFAKVLEIAAKSKAEQDAAS